MRRGAFVWGVFIGTILVVGFWFGFAVIGPELVVKHPHPTTTTTVPPSCAQAVNV